jgi:hypothetical protein
MSDIIAAAVLISLLAAYAFIEIGIARLIKRFVRAARRIPGEYRRANGLQPDGSAQAVTEPKGDK